MFAKYKRKFVEFFKLNVRGQRVLNGLYHAFLVLYDSAPRLAPSPPLPSATCLSFSVFLCVAGRGDGRGAKSANQTTARKPGPPL
jgi:hypothetical protein